MQFTFLCTMSLSVRINQTNIVCIATYCDMVCQSDILLARKTIKHGSSDC